LLNAFSIANEKLKREKLIKARSVDFMCVELPNLNKFRRSSSQSIDAHIRNKCNSIFTENSFINKVINLNLAKHVFTSFFSFSHARCSTLSVSDNSRISVRCDGDYCFAYRFRDCMLLLSFPSISFFVTAVIKDTREAFIAEIRCINLSQFSINASPRIRMCAKRDSNRHNY